MPDEFKFAIKPFHTIGLTTDNESIDSIITRIDGKLIVITRVPENKIEHHEDELSTASINTPKSK